MVPIVGLVVVIIRVIRGNHSLMDPIVGLVVVIIRVIRANQNAVSYNDYTTKRGRYMGETYEKGSLKKYTYKLKKISKNSTRKLKLEGMVNITVRPLGNNKGNALLTKKLRIFVLSLRLPGIPRAPVIQVCNRRDNNE